MLVAVSLFEDGLGALLRLASVGIVATQLIQHGQVVEALPQIVDLLAAHAFVGGARVDVERLGTVVGADELHEIAVVVERARHVAMIGAELRQANREHPLVVLGQSLGEPRGAEQIRLVVQALGGEQMVGTERALANRDRALREVRGARERRVSASPHGFDQQVERFAEPQRIPRRARIERIDPEASQRLRLGKALRRDQRADRRRVGRGRAAVEYSRCGGGGRPKENELEHEVRVRASGAVRLNPSPRRPDLRGSTAGGLP